MSANHNLLPAYPCGKSADDHRGLTTHTVGHTAEATAACITHYGNLCFESGATSLTAVIAALTAERDALRHSAAVLGWLYEHNILVMKAAWIAADLGPSVDCVEWIDNTLSNGDALPDADKALALGGAQAWFDAELVKLGDMPGTQPVAQGMKP